MTRAALVAALDLSRLSFRLQHGRFTIGAGERAAMRIAIARAIAALGGREMPLRTAELLDDETARACLLTMIEALSAAGIDNAAMAAWFNETAINRIGGQDEAHR
jgi:hypothetical protein